MEQHFPKFPNKRSTSRGIARFSKKFSREFLEFSVEWLAFRKFNSSQKLWKLFREISVSFAAVSNFSKVLVEWKGPRKSASFPFSPEFLKFRLNIKWNGPFRFGPTAIFGTSFKGGPLWPVGSFWSVGPKCPFPCDKIVVPSTALFHPAYKGSHWTIT